MLSLSVFGVTQNMSGDWEWHGHDWMTTLSDKLLAILRNGLWIRSDQIIIIMPAP